MKISITKGMDGRSIKIIDAKCKTVKSAFEEITAWKNAHENNDKYRICHYDRILFKEDEHKLIIDFGDYSYFIRVACSKSEWNDVVAWHNRPVNLEV